MADPQNEFRPTILLDTNVLHFMSSYLRWAQKKNWPPFQSGATLGQVGSVLRQHLPESIAKHILKGTKTLAYLEQQVMDHHAAIYTSRLAKAEVIYGVLEGQAHARMAREGLPYRMRQRAGILNELVSMYLEPHDYQQVIAEWDNFLDLLESKGGITVVYVEDQEGFSKIAEVAEFVQSRIFMDVIDSWMYACALVMKAEAIITFDGYFKRVINMLHNPQHQPDWQTLRSDLQQMLRERLPGEPTLPKVEDPPQSLPKRW